MNTLTTRWHRGALRLLGTGLVVALAGTAVLTAHAAPPDGPRHGPMMGGGMHGPGGMHGAGAMSGQHVERMLDLVAATAEQRAQIRKIMDSARDDLRGQRDARRALHDQMRQLFTQPTVDARAAETLRQQQLALHDKASQRMMQAMIEASRVLTPEQRAKLAEQMGRRHEMMERRGPPR